MIVLLNISSNDVNVDLMKLRLREYIEQNMNTIILNHKIAYIKICLVSSENVFDFLYF